jgi:hypothetical protein
MAACKHPAGLFAADFWGPVGVSVCVYMGDVKDIGALIGISYFYI